MKKTIIKEVEFVIGVYDKVSDQLMTEIKLLDSNIINMFYFIDDNSYPPFEIDSDTFIYLKKNGLFPSNYTYDKYSFIFELWDIND